MSRWDIEAKEIPAFLLRQGSALNATQRKELLLRRTFLNRVLQELRDAMLEMPVEYRGIVDGVVVIEASTEDECWKAIGNRGVVEFRLSTNWALTDNAIAHEK